MRSLLNALIFLTLALTATARAQAVDSLVNRFDERREQADLDRDEQLKKLSDSYVIALKRLLDRTKSGGNLDAVRPVNDEITAIEDKAATLPPLPDTAPADLKKLRATYDDSRHKILKTHATALTDLAGKLDAALKKLEAELTKTGKIDAAVAAREELAKDQALTDARDLLKLGGSTAKGKPALQLRRYGDNLEVLVYYDRAGKISMDSPVENTRERTGEGKELGDTKAKVLGEFVGAKGYTVDPYVAFDHIFDGKDIAGMIFLGLDHETGFDSEKEKGLKISFTKGEAKYRCGILKGLLPPKASDGTVQITARYFIPKTNRTVDGLVVGPSSGKPLGEVFAAKGKWTRATTSGIAADELTSLFITLKRGDNASVKDTAGEYVVLGALKVEYTGFSAFVQRRFSDDGGAGDGRTEAAEQPASIVNGEILKQ
ncbi:MAG: hypothetical protein J0M04_14015 [Verrucomicrobia bacterium]|nr:hypothetical protein [Verrucomicrobiota bacterium]